MLASLEASRKMTRRDMPLCVVVTGPSAAGKTTIARALSSELRLALVEKDTVEEALFDGLGTGDLEWSQRLGVAAYLVLLGVVEAAVEAGAGIVVEANFVHGSEVAGRLARLPARFVQVHCSAPLELLVERRRKRERHPGHVDTEPAAALREAVESGRHAPLGLPGETIRLDTSEPVDAEALLARVRRSALWQAVGEAVGPPGEATPLTEKVRSAAWTITDADAAGLSADELYEAVLPVAFAAADEARRRAHEAIDAG